ncbi:hypothetical protein CAPTEDRAFT_192021 [Capitella teleta]|uniref:THD domain-containing protein n=1 Tax=Capitella teleta TaxID=283909 RepID=R7TA61_CAPTE|nr:hypothetical protein CAPTEDRAFT_192021 [Capitella teleta]|eukprot:ELT90633.1 hypothetical protein CAPTEDRAFT_192021 [Capitella teleta]
MAAESQRRKISRLTAVFTVFILLLTLVNFAAVLYLSLSLSDVKEKLAQLQSIGSDGQSREISEIEYSSLSDRSSRRTKRTSDSNSSLDFKELSLRLLNGAIQAKLHECLSDGTRRKTNKTDNEKLSLSLFTKELLIIDLLLVLVEVSVIGGTFHRIRGFQPGLEKGLRGLWKVDQEHSLQGHIGPNQLFDDSQIDNGKVIVQESGIYLIYFQVIFQTSAERNLHQSVDLMNGDDSLASCVVLESFSRDNPTSNTPSLTNSGDSHVSSVFQPCASTIVVHLREGSSLGLSNLYHNRWILPAEHLTFWGITKLH